MILGSIWRDLGIHFGGYFWTRSAQEEPRRDQEDHQELERTENLHLQKPQKTTGFSRFLGGPRLSKTASEDPRRVPRGYLGLLGAILSHLGAILETRAFKIAPAGWDRCPCSPPWTILGSILGPKISLIFTFSGVIFGISFWTIFGPLWGPFWGPFWGQIGPRRGQDEPKRAIKRY